jgi:hypothetical protein
VGALRQWTATCPDPTLVATTGRLASTSMIEFGVGRFAAAVRAYAPQWERAAIRWQLTFGPEREKSLPGLPAGPMIWLAGSSYGTAAKPNWRSGTS